MCYWLMLSRKSKRIVVGLVKATAVSILLFKENLKPSGIFPKKMPPRIIFRWQNVNRNRSKGESNRGG